MKKTFKKFTKTVRDKREEVQSMRMKILKNLSQKVERLEEKTDKIQDFGSVPPAGPAVGRMPVGGYPGDGKRRVQ